MDNYRKFAKVLVEYSCSVQKGEKVLIDQSCVDPEFLVVLIEEVKKAGGIPFVWNSVPEVSKALLCGMTEEYAKLKTKFDLPIMKEMDAYISIGGSQNIFETSDVPSENMKIYSQLYVQPVHYDERVNHTKWIISNWPTPALAQSANISTQAYKDIFFKVCTLDYGKMSLAMDKLVERMQKTDKVRIVGQGTDLTFSIKGQPAIKCDGKNNIPDGEVFTGPIKNSLNGTIKYNIPSVYHGKRFDDVCFKIKDGKIIEATANGNEKALNEILDTDDGARFFGEFAIGVNPYITKPMLDILFDEKICGSIHLTPGSCYDEAPNGNTSAIHWDLVLCQTEEYGGGEIYFDDVLIRKNGRFVVADLQGLNPENLI